MRKSASHLAEFEFCYCDIETYAPGSDDPQFWFGGIKSNGVYRWTDNIETYLHWLFFEKRKARKKILLFFNSEYDMSQLQYYLKENHGYKENPKKNTGDKCFYTGQKWEVYTDHHQYRQPISVVDIKPLLTGGVRKWGEILNFEKGETPVVDEYRPPTEKDLAYLKRDVEIIEKASHETEVEQAIKDGCLTISSVVNHDIKNGMRKLRGTPTRKSGFKAKHNVPEQKENNVPYAILKRADKAVEEYIETYTCKKDGKVLFKPCQDEVKEYRSRVIRAYLKQLEYDYTKEVLKPLRVYYRAKYMKLDVKKELFVSGADINTKYLERIIITTVNESIRPGLRGGISWVNPVYKNKILPPGFTLDINSMYPSVILDTELPYDFVGMSTDEEPDLDKYFVAEITELKAKVKSGHHPWLKRSTAYTRDKYYEPSIHWKGHINKSKQAWDTVLTSADINYMYECYDVEKIEYRRIFYFNPNKDFTKVVRDYINHWRHIKETSTGAYRELAKLHLNALWGRWAMTTKIVEDGGQKIDVGERTSNLVSAMFVTTYARIRLNRMMNRFYDYVVYTDTDSVHVLFPPGKTQEDVEESISDLIHPTMFGKWKIEQTWQRAKYIKPKTYCHEDKDGDLDFTAAGVPNKYIKHSFKTLEGFKTGITFQVLKKVKLEDGRISLQQFPSTI